jgi:hypothetical protein
MQVSSEITYTSNIILSFHRVMARGISSTIHSEPKFLYLGKIQYELFLLFVLASHICRYAAFGSLSPVFMGSNGIVVTCDVRPPVGRSDLPVISFRRFR